MNPHPLSDATVLIVTILVVYYWARAIDTVIGTVKELWESWTR